LKKFEWDPSSFYLKENDSRAFIKPTFAFGNPDPLDIEAIQSIKFSLKEFTILFEELQEGRRPDWMPHILSSGSYTDQADLSMVEEPDELTSPKFATKDSGIFALVPMLSFESDGEEPDQMESTLSPEEVSALLKEYKKRFASLKSKWTQTFLEVEASHALVVKDLLLLHKSSSVLRSIIGTPDPKSSAPLMTSVKVLSDEVRNVATAQADTHASVNSVLKTQQDFRQSIIEAVEENESHFLSAVQELTSMKDQISQVTLSVKEHEKRFSIIFPILQEFKQSSARSSAPASAELLALQNQVESLKQKLARLEQDAWAQMTSPTTNPVALPAVSTTSPPSNFDASILDLKHQVKVLQHRIVGGRVRIGNKVFQSFEDVQIWVKAELPTHRYGLFVDAVSILDFFSFLGHIDAKSQVSTLHNANKAGFTSIYESRVATSVQNIFPKVFGKGDSHQYLPAIRHPDK
jgi:hypothetical protein